MNLRQKVKNAKKELKFVKETYPESCDYDIYKKYEKVFELEKIINYKRKFNRYYNSNEDYEIDWKKLTYVAFSAEFKEFDALKSPNGKPLSKKEIYSFIYNIMKTKFYHYSKLISKSEPCSEKYAIRHVDYCLVVSNDRTKNKRLHTEKIWYQFKGSDKIYVYEKQK